MGPYQRTPKLVGRVIRYSGFGVRSVGPVGDFLDSNMFFLIFKFICISGVFSFFRLYVFRDDFLYILIYCIYLGQNGLNSG